MNPTRIVSLALMAFALTACASVSDEKRARPEDVRVVTTADEVRGCQLIGSATDDNIGDLQKRVARRGGNVALITLQAEARSGHGASYKVRTYTTADVYRCGTAQ